jgi:hypothetical protein
MAARKKPRKTIERLFSRQKRRIAVLSVVGQADGDPERQAGGDHDRVGREDGAHQLSSGCSRGSSG